MAVTPRKISIETEVEKGKFIENRNLIVDAIEVYEGKKVKVTIERFFRKITKKEINYYWGVIIEHWKNIILQEWGEIWTKDEVHEFLKREFNAEEVVDYETGEIIFNPTTNKPFTKTKSITKNTTKDQEEYHEKCRQVAWEMFEYQIPLPNEDLSQPIDVKF